MISLTDVSVTFDGRRRVQALRGVTLDVTREFLVLVGPSGSGKSTILNLLAGFVRASTGTLSTTNPGELDFAFVFQDHSILPWLTVRQNIELAHRVRGVPRDTYERETASILERLGLTDAASLLPHQLSGGMRQRAAVGRAFAQRPSLLLMDEPFGSVDTVTREGLQATVTDLFEATGSAVVFVTHDIEEAVLLADRVVVLSHRPGTVVSSIPINLGRPRDLSLRWNSQVASLRKDIESMLRELEAPGCRFAAVGEIAR